MSDAAEMMTRSKVLEEDTKVQAHGAASAAGAVPVGGDQPDSFKPASRPQHDTPHHHHAPRDCPVVAAGCLLLRLPPGPGKVAVTNFRGGGVAGGAGRTCVGARGGAGAHLDGAGRPCSRLPPALRRRPRISHLGARAPRPRRHTFLGAAATAAP